MINGVIASEQFQAMTIPPEAIEVGSR
jgi:hypothetical protein